MSKEYINVSTILDGELVQPGFHEITAEKKKEFKEKGYIGEKKKTGSPTNEKEIKELVAKVAELEKGADKALKSENEDLKSENKDLKKENEDLRKDLQSLAGDKEENKSILSKWGFGKN